MCDENERIENGIHLKYLLKLRNVRQHRTFSRVYPVAREAGHPNL